MQIPDLLYLSFYDKNKKVIDNLLVEIIIPVTKGLPYGTRPYLTDEKGKIIIKKIEIIEDVNYLYKYDFSPHKIPFDKLETKVNIKVPNLRSIERTCSLLGDVYYYYDYKLVDNDEKKIYDKKMFDLYMIYSELPLKNKQVEETIFIKNIDLSNGDIEVIVPYEFE